MDKAAPGNRVISRSAVQDINRGPVDVPFKVLEQYTPDLSQQITGLGLWLCDRFSEVETQRLMVEDRWLADKRQYEGRYEPEEWRKLKQHKFRSKLFAKMTRKKVKAFDSRMMEMLFPAGKDRNWAIRNTPNPDVMMTPVAQQLLLQEQQKVADADVQRLAQENNESPEAVIRTLKAGGYVPQVPQEKIREIQLAVAKSTSEQMSRTIADQMTQVSYKLHCKRALHSGHKYGTGILKGPLAQRSQRPVWYFREGKWQMESEEVLNPFLEFVSVWSFYPDNCAKDPDSMEFCFQRHLMIKNKVGQLASRPGFDAEIIRKYLIEFPSGDTSELSWETQVDSDDDRNDTLEERTSRRYQVLEYTGVLNDAFLRDLGLEPDPLKGIWVNVWVLGHFVIRITRSPIKGMDHPYHFYLFDEAEGSFWGNGVPEVMRDDQHALNSIIRAMMDNAASTVGPQWDVNTEYLKPGEKIDEIYPNRIWARRGDGKNPAIRAVEVSSRLGEFLSLKQTFENQIHEATLPAYMQGTQAGGAGRTASGLSMLMGSANLDVKDQITNFDLGVTRSLVAGFYHWNMQFNADENIKGDFEVIARGSSSLVSKEIRTQQLDQLLPLLMNPLYAKYIDQRQLLDEIFKCRDMLDSDILLSEEEFNERQQMQQTISQQQKKLDEGMQLLEKLWKIAPTLVREAMDKIPPAPIEAYQQRGMQQ